jgi:hypothetical protein
VSQPPSDRLAIREALHQGHALGVAGQVLPCGKGLGEQRIGGVDGGQQGLALQGQITFADGEEVLIGVLPLQNQQALLADRNGGFGGGAGDHRQGAVQPTIAGVGQVAIGTARAVFQRILPDEMAAALAVGGGDGMGKGHLARRP